MVRCALCVVHCALCVVRVGRRASGFSHPSGLALVNIFLNRTSAGTGRAVTDSTEKRRRAPQHHRCIPPTPFTTRPESRPLVLGIVADQLERGA